MNACNVERSEESRGPEAYRPALADRTNQMKKAAMMCDNSRSRSGEVLQSLRVQHPDCFPFADTHDPFRNP